MYLLCHHPVAHEDKQRRPRQSFLETGTAERQGRKKGIINRKLLKTSGVMGIVVGQGFQEKTQICCCAGVDDCSRLRMGRVKLMFP